LHVHIDLAPKAAVKLLADFILLAGVSPGAEFQFGGLCMGEAASGNEGSNQ